MKKTSLDAVGEVHCVLRSILSKCIEVFEKHDLRYVLIYGSLLGAVRHNGFIPWDDDLDIAMPREDLEKFKAIFSSEMGEDYFYQDCLTDEEYPSIEAKVRYNNSTIIENGYRNLKKMNHGLFLDIFVCDRYDASAISSFRVFLVKICRKLLLEQKVCTVGRASRFLANLFPRKFLYKLSQNLLLRLNSKRQNSKYLMCAQTVLPENLFDEYIYCNFENLQVRIPKDYDKVLTDEYGDYMQLPPLESQRPLHMTELLSTDVPFKEFIKNI